MACYVILRSVPSQKHIIFASFCIGFMPNELSCASRISHAVLRGHFRPRPGEIDSPGITRLPRHHHKAPGEGSSIPTRLSPAFFFVLHQWIFRFASPRTPGFLSWDPYKLFSLGPLQTLLALHPYKLFPGTLGGQISDLYKLFTWIL